MPTPMRLQLLNVDRAAGDRTSVVESLERQLVGSQHSPRQSGPQWHAMSDASASLAGPLLLGAPVL
jgi:hypothetical protein